MKTLTLLGRRNRWYWSLEYQPGPVVYALFLGLFYIAWMGCPCCKGWRSIHFGWNLD